MTELLTAGQMRAIEQAPMDRGDVTGLELMERAGRGVVDAIFAHWPELAQTSHRAVVFCGPGNNGGDGFVVARLLHDWGWEVDVFLYGDPQRLPPDARMNYERWCALGPVGDMPSDAGAGPLWDGADLAIDALFGTGLARPLEELTPILAGLTDAAARFADPATNGSGQVVAPRVVAIDVPSGLDADSGKALQPSHSGVGAASANLTVSFHRRKLGQVLADGPSHCRKTVVCDIGLTETAADPAIARAVEPAAAALSKRASDHKYAHGHALVLSGPLGTGGAARLSARGALRIGAGLVSVVCDDAAVAEHAAQLTAIMIKPANGAGGVRDLLRDNRFNALCLGPGLGVDRARDMVPVALEAGHNPALVLDADALTAYQASPDALFSRLHENCVLTPHSGEFKRLFPDIAAKLAATPTKGPAYSKVDATREAAARAGCTVLFKGPDTVIARPDGHASVHTAHDDRAAPWLATAGSGDVLAGFITGLLARGFAPMQAAETAVWLHVECARSFGPGLIAEDLPEIVPQVLRALAA